MAKRHNLFFQLQSGIDRSFRESMDKNSDKSKHFGTNETMTKVYSYNERKTLLQISKEFKDFMKNDHPDIKLIKSVTAEHWQEYLDNKAKTCSTESLKLKVALINKLEVLTCNFFKISLNWRNNIIPPVSAKTPNNAKLRGIQMDQADYNKLISFTKDSNSMAVPAIQLCYHYGLRVSEIANLKVKNIDFENNALFIEKSKGGRNRTLSLEPTTIPLLKELIAGKGTNDTIINIKSDSINKFLNRKLTALNLKEKYQETSIHSIRKLSAQNKFDYLRQNHNKATSCQMVSVWLGHGKDRSDIYSIYISNIY